ncbi:aminotransferase [Streptomyces scopuliridis]
MPHDEYRTIDFFTENALPAPCVAPAEAEHIAAEHLGITARAQSLGSQQDANFLPHTDDGTPAATLKIVKPAFGTTEIEAQDAAADLIASAHPELRIATVLRRPDGSPRRTTVDTENGPAVARLLRYLPGGTLPGSQHLSPRTVAAMGTIAGKVSTALRDFHHPGLDRVLQWDPRHADRVVAKLAGHIDEPDRRAAVQAATADAWARVQELAAALPLQTVHQDLTDDNLIRCPDTRPPMPDGVIDFGDVTKSWAVGELAVSLSSMLHHDGIEPHHLLPAVRAFHAVRPVSPEEAEALWPLVILRAAVLVAGGRQQAAVDEDNTYAKAALDREWRIFEQATWLPMPVMSRLVRDATDMADIPAQTKHAAAPVRPLLRDLAAADITLVDLSTDADFLNQGAWLEAGTEGRLAASSLADGAVAVATRYAQARLTRAPALSAVSAATVPTGIDVWFGRDAVAQAPGTGMVLAAAPGRVEFVHGAQVLTLSFPSTVHPAITTGATVQAGEDIARVPSGAALHITLSAADSPAVPALVRPEYASGWLAFTADPASLLGLPVDSDGTGERDPLDRRDAVFATVQEHYYANPPRIERGWRHHLLSTDGRSYLDIVNNVTPLGHTHPRVEQAVSRQLRRLNTNSRFHYASVVEFTERLAIGATGQHDVVALREAYHGWTYASDAVSTSLQDNPDALATRPSWVHTVDSPNSCRGRHRGANAVRYAPEAVAEIDELAAAGRPAGAFISETFYGDAGGVALPDGYWLRLRGDPHGAKRHPGDQYPPRRTPATVRRIDRARQGHQHAAVRRGGRRAGQARPR